MNTKLPTQFLMAYISASCIQTSIHSDESYVNDHTNDYTTITIHYTDYAFSSQKHT